MYIKYIIYLKLYSEYYLFDTNLLTNLNKRVLLFLNY